jgi:tetratricopeptide (TPR) repeat protein
LAEAAGEDFYAVDAAHMMGIVEQPHEAVNWSLRALEMAEASKQARAKKWLGALYNNIGWSYHDAGEYEKALGIFRKALVWREEQGEIKSIRMARWGRRPGASVAWKSRGGPRCTAVVARRSGQDRRPRRLRLRGARRVSARHGQARRGGRSTSGAPTRSSRKTPGWPRAARSRLRRLRDLGAGKSGEQGAEPPRNTDSRRDADGPAIRVNHKRLRALKLARLPIGVEGCVAED